jgi:hypothetical protein
MISSSSLGATRRKTVKETRGQDDLATVKNSKPIQRAEPVGAFGFHNQTKVNFPNFDDNLILQHLFILMASGNATSKGVHCQKRSHHQAGHSQPI